MRCQAAARSIRDASAPSRAAGKIVRSSFRSARRAPPAGWPKRDVVSPRSPPDPMSDALLTLTDVARSFDVSPPWLDRVLERKPRALLKAVDGVSLAIAPGETLGLVGESGCGKSTVARLIVGLYTPTRGTIEFDGAVVAGDEAVDSAKQRLARRGMQMIFQDP